MTRHLFFAIIVIGTGAFLNSPVEAATALQCEDRTANCLGSRCRDMTGGAGDVKGRQNKCVLACIRQLERCYPRYWTRPL
jgi:hypothetical protein